MRGGGGDDDRPYPMPRTHIEGRVSRIERGKSDTGHRLPAWLRPGTKWPPGKKVTSSSPGPWKTWRRPRRFLRRYPPSGFGSMAQRANGRAFRSAQPAPMVPAPAAQPVLLTSRLVGGRTRPAPGLTSHLRYSALSQALLTLRRPVSIRHARSEAAWARHMVGWSLAPC